jgi:tRNA A-37 threonylcarbamoyl transferase component Bud32
VTPPADDPVLSGRYQLEARIGAGGAGAVWRAVDTVLGRSVAVKLLHDEVEQDPATRERFRREATAAAAIHHPNAAVIYDIGHDGRRDYLVMELVDGPSLAEVLDDGPLPAPVVVTLGHQVAAALGAAHARGMAHRDVKPGNVLLTRDGAAKVVDFGIAKAVGEATQDLTAAGTVVGTAPYLAPEQLEPGAPVDARADVYTLGLVLHRCLTGEPPFQGTPTEMAAQRLVADAPRPRDRRPDVPAALDEVVARATRRDPAARYADGRELAAALAPLLPDPHGRPTHDLARTTAAVDTERTRVLTVAAPSRPADAPVGATVPVARSDDTLDLAAVVLPPDPTPRAETARTRPAEPEPTRDALSVRGAVLAGLVLVVLAVVAAMVLTGTGTGTGDRVAGGGRGNGSGGEDTGGAPHAVADAGDFDPFGDGEHPEDVPKAYDGDPRTVWNTQRYTTASFGNLKPGVGIWFDLGEPVAVERVSMLLATAGVDLEVYASDEPFADGELGEPLVRLEDAPAEPALEIGGAEGRYWLLWLTRVPGGRAEIAEVAFARP